MHEYLIESFLIRQRIHLIGGASNVGKTRWILPTMVEWSQGKPIMGFASHPRPWAYVSGDRLLTEAQQSIKSLGLSLSDIPIIPAFGQHNKTWVQVLVEAARMKVEVLVWEGFGDLAPDPQRRAQVREFLSRIAAHCAAPTLDFPNSLTILGIMESPKMKPYERYKNPRERISGVASWVYHTSGVLMIDAANPASPADSNRVLYASLKTDPSFTSLGAFNGGKLTFGPPISVTDDGDYDLDQLAQAFMASEKAAKSNKIS